MAHFKKVGKPYFLFCNLYDVHAPYPPVDDSIFLPMNKASNIVDNINAFQGLAKISLHAYLQAGFSLPEAQRLALLARYRSAVERMDRTVGQFYAAAQAEGLLDDTLFVLTSDHGEAFGEHDVYLHDASLFDENISVPLWIKHPHHKPQEIDDVVTTRGLYEVMRSAAGLEREANTIVDAEYRSRHPVAFAEHFYYPHVQNIAPRYAQNITATITREFKIISRREGAEMYDRSSDPWERKPLSPNPDEVYDVVGEAKLERA
jgi:arylsulfatase A-like enzyme